MMNFKLLSIFLLISCVGFANNERSFGGYSTSRVGSYHFLGTSLLDVDDSTRNIFEILTDEDFFEKLGILYSSGSVPTLEDFDPDRVLKGHSIFKRQPNKILEGKLATIIVGDEIVGTKRYSDVFTPHASEPDIKKALYDNSPLELNVAMKAVTYRSPGSESECGYATRSRIALTESGKRVLIQEIRSDDQRPVCNPGVEGWFSGDLLFRAYFQLP